MIRAVALSHNLALVALFSLVVSGCVTDQAAMVTSTDPAKPEEAKQTIPTSPIALSQDRYALGESADQYENGPWKKIATEADQARL